MSHNEKVNRTALAVPPLSALFGAMEAMMQFPEAKKAFCAKHLEPFREEWPRGFGMLCMEILEAVMEHPRFMAHFSRRPDGKLQFEDEVATRALEAECPLCCLVGDEVMASITSMVLARDS